jgi:hypothetical protein
LSRKNTSWNVSFDTSLPFVSIAHTTPVSWATVFVFASAVRSNTSPLPRRVRILLRSLGSYRVVIALAKRFPPSPTFAAFRQMVRIRSASFASEDDGFRPVLVRLADVDFFFFFFAMCGLPARSRHR